MYSEHADYYYIVVTILERKYFVTPKLDFVQQFDNILKFNTYEEAKVFSERENLDKFDAVVLGVNECN